MDKLVEIAAQIQYWLDYQERERGEDGVNDDVHLMSPPVWPTRGQLKNWIRALTADAGMERAAEICDRLLDDEVMSKHVNSASCNAARTAILKCANAIRAAADKVDAGHDKPLIRAHLGLPSAPAGQVVVPVATLILMRMAITDDAPFGKRAIAAYEKLRAAGSRQDG